MSVGLGRLQPSLASVGALGWEEQEQPRACLNMRAAPAKGDIGGGLGPSHLIEKLQNLLTYLHDSTYWTPIECQGIEIGT